MTRENAREAADAAWTNGHANGHVNGYTNGHTAPDTAAFPFHLLTLGHWLDRDVPAPDFILGEVLSTTSRAMLVGPTGLGKTMFGLALAMAIAEGRDFLHWRVPKPRRVLYLDGEMSRRLMKKRIADEMQRRGTDRETNLFVLSREDFPNLAPLNSEAGQQFIDHAIKALGSVDMIFVDNIQAWTTGDMREETSWEPVLPWLRDLTRRGIGQLWIHHTGHDESHSYGSKTREWQLDAVMLMEDAESAGSDLAFRLKFTKARERGPENRSDFEPAIITLAGNEWASETGGERYVPRKRTLEDQALDALDEALAKGAQTPLGHPEIPPDTYCVQLPLWLGYFRKSYIGEAKPESVERKFRYLAQKLQLAGRIGVSRDWVWRPRLNTSQPHFAFLGGSDFGLPPTGGEPRESGPNPD